MKKQGDLGHKLAGPGWPGVQRPPGATSVWSLKAQTKIIQEVTTQRDQPVALNTGLTVLLFFASLTGTENKVFQSARPRACK